MNIMTPVHLSICAKIHASKIEQVEAIGQELKSVIKTNYPPEVLQLAPEKLPKPKRKVISQPSFFRVYVKLRGVYVSSDERIKILGKQIQAYVRDPEHHGRNMVIAVVDLGLGLGPEVRIARILHTMLSLKWSDRSRVRLFNFSQDDNPTYCTSGRCEECQNGQRSYPCQMTWTSGAG